MERNQHIYRVEFSRHGDGTVKPSYWAFDHTTLRCYRFPVSSEIFHDYCNIHQDCRDISERVFLLTVTAIVKVTRSNRQTNKPRSNTPSRMSSDPVGSYWNPRCRIPITYDRVLVNSIRIQNLPPHSAENRSKPVIEFGVLGTTESRETIEETRDLLNLLSIERHTWLDEMS